MNFFVYSIGHGNKAIEQFVSELKKFDIQFLIDVRSKPYSKHHPQFNLPVLQHSPNFVNNGIKYAYMGDELGGLPTNSACYTNGRVDYGKLSRDAAFQHGLKRIIDANEKHFRICIMCSESDPKQCHRTKLIGEELRKVGIIMQHITRNHYGDTVTKPQTDIMNELNNGDKDLFGDKSELTSRKQYI